jgi:predicted kinase
MPSLYIIRGAPGSGKTTFGLRLRAGGLVRYVLSADDYMTGTGGKYNFDPRRLKECHERCQMDAIRHLRGFESVAVCNTFTRIWEMQPYVNMARNIGAELFVIKCEGNFRNIHGVPDQKVREMRDRFEDWQG